METGDLTLQPKADEGMESNHPQSPKSTVVNMKNAAQTQPHSHSRPVPDHILWSLFNAFYLNACCLGFLALAFSIKARDSKVANNMRRARRFASTARGLNVAATLFSLILIAAGIAYYLYVTVAHLTP
ncbi:dispanin subfamily A member 2b-like [Chiloscyllium plagiosum]|uniref:dispanin subfamily A member 2b-like n=1 Tax=Chiloscyllium plagiosum TaxID=36176 RepID=UPI001CB7C9B4|nr:dispanin subfamily A member 2b-like [Chiloscyllium plagiosum]